MNLDQALQTFLAESRELLQDMESMLLQADGAGDHTEALNAIFRAAHTIKGSAGLFGLDDIVAFTHVVEGTLDEVRSGRLVLDSELVAELLASSDHVAALVDAVEAGGTADAQTQAAGRAIVGRLRQRSGAQEEVRSVSAAPGGGDAPAERWHIAVAYGPDVLRHGLDPVAFVRYLRKLGSITSIVTSAPAMPPSEAMDPESCYLVVDLVLDTRAGRAAIEDAFEFVREHCRLAIDAVPAESAAPEPQASTGPAGSGRAGEGQTIRVDAGRLDHLIDMIGELTIAAASANLAARRAANVELQESNATLLGLVEQVRDSALQLRMVRIAGTFNRFKRLVHDVSRELGKEIVLAIDGEDTELDKTVVEKIADPLTHLVRNAMDHGIEPAEARIAAGKSARGTVRLNAYHDSGSIVIEVADDGAGLRTERILARAIERGLVAEGATPTEQEIHDLIFEAGFSTAEQVTNLSGRGVGMDVVKRNIAALRGSVSLESRAGQGTRVSVRLPLTLAIIDGFLVQVGKAVFVVPLDMIEECVAYSSEPGRDYTNLRGQVLPFVRLRELFEVNEPPARRESIVVVKHAGRKMGLVVDALLGEFQTVIKPLGRMFSHVRCLSGSTILGSGEVALIVDVPALMKGATESVPARAVASQ